MCFKHVHFVICQLHFNKAVKQSKPERASLTRAWDNTKSPNVHVIGVAEEKRGSEEGTEKHLRIKWQEMLQNRGQNHQLTSPTMPMNSKPETK